MLIDNKYCAMDYTMIKYYSWMTMMKMKPQIDDVILRKNRTRAPSKEEQQSNRGILPMLLQLVDVAHVIRRVDYKTFQIAIKTRCIRTGFSVMSRRLDKSSRKIQKDKNKRQKIKNNHPRWTELFIDPYFYERLV